MNFMNGLPMNPGFSPGYQNGHGGGYGGGYGGGGGGGRGRGRRDDNRRGGRGRGGGGHGGGGGHERHVPESSSQRFRKMIIRFADEDDFHPIEDPPRLAKVLKRQWREGSQGVCDGFRIGITQEPHKHHHFVTLLLALSLRPPPLLERSPVKEEEEAETGEKRKAPPEDDGPDCAREVLEDLGRAFRSWVEGREWLNMRLCLQFYSALVPAGLISPRSLLDLYKSLLAVLSELGGGGDRADRVVRSVVEGLMRSGKALYDTYPDEVLEMVDTIISSIQSRRGGKALFQPLSPILPHGEESESVLDSFDHLLLALQSLRAEEFASPPLLTPHHAEFPIPDDMVRPPSFDLDTVSMPPELYDADEDRWQTGEGQIGNLVLFAEDVVPSPSTPLGWVLRSLLLDVVHVFEVNRKESARILLSLSRFIAPGTFKSAAPSTSAPSGSESTISLESSLISTLLNVMFLLPHSPCKLIYYSSVITELCKISPNTVAPPVGRAVRKLYGMMGTDGLDVEIQRRAAEWFAVHLSNFGFQWMWKEWIPDLALPASHPKRAFIRRIVELEVRLAYHDRILDTLPEAMASESAGVISAVPPDPVWPYSSSDHPLHAEATELHRLFRTKEPSTAIRTHLLALPNATSGPDEPLTPEMRLMAVETLLHLGSRSFSHFLNATERYLDTLRFLSPDPSSRRIVLDGVANFWRNSAQMRLVTVDKYLQYGVLEAVDVVDWVFAEDSGVLRSGDEGDGWTDGDRWEMLRMALDKLVGKVTALRKRVNAAERDDEAARARRAAERLEQGEGVGEAEADMDEDTRVDRSRAARDAQSSLDISSTKLEKVLLATTKHFVASLCPWCFDPTSSSQGLKSVLELLESGEEGWWGVRARWGWYAEFLRLYSAHLGPLDEVVEKEVLVCPPKHDPGKEGEVEVRAEGMVRGVWLSAVRGTEAE